MDFKKISILSKYIKKGSEKHFKLFFQITHGVVFGVCVKMGLSQEDAEEIVQDTYIQFWKQRDSIDENNGVIGLLKLIAKRLVIKKINKKELTVLNNLDEIHKISDNSDLKGTVNSNLIKENIKKLPPTQKEIITLFYLEGLTTIEISNYLKVSVRTVENNLYRAKKKLKQILDFQNLNTNSFYDFFNE
ncbi:sigma-70 family RNA polymerase sigma factor [Tamlana sp. 2201CG12-4]|uniref:RNA polymerase sigma factor n=1 Tax=Tamlana sp. 2201CG12-4 TaxID=3112582 RepID=UPI002DB80B9D|nr:sigma-70 family RNA polymerase sigma factor [Tamlana sp. 2201CG12-4]MEC3906734.1 sigma-70 family RNA polymerase sigma factor [Tamlana sp. 2201CG12-4]